MISFKRYYNLYLEEKNEGDRVGIQHLYSLNKPEINSMDYQTFTRFVGYLEANGGKINPSNSSVSEKVDGMALKVGKDETGHFFLQSSYSGKVYNPQEFNTKIKYEGAQRAFIDGFDKLKNIVEPLISSSSCTIQLEWLYSPNATRLEDRPGMVSFVTAAYETSKLGTWSTFVIINVECHGLDKNKIINSLIKSSTEEIRFLLPNVELFRTIDLISELTRAKHAIGNIQKGGIVEQINHLKGNRQRAAIQQRRDLEKQIREAVLPIQKQMYEKIISNLLKTEGILGDIEGYVIKAGDLLFKVNNPNFMVAKFEL